MMWPKLLTRLSTWSPRSARTSDRVVYEVFLSASASSPKNSFGWRAC